MRILCGTVLCAALAATADFPVIVVRHAERAGGTGNDVPLSDAGRCRAARLAALLADAGVKNIYASEAARTRLTAEPLAARLGVTVREQPARDVAALVSAVREAARLGAVLVVGHSNTVPEIVERLGGGKPAPIGEGEFDRLYVLTPGNPAALLHYPGCGP
jgi:phosphohistidine phosphatase SixA